MTQFEDIYVQYAPQIFRVCMGYVNDVEIARDLTQETFIQVWKNLPKFQYRSKVSTWIFRIATNNCLRAIERSSRMPTTALPPELAEKQADSALNDKLLFLYKCIVELEEAERIIISLVLEDVPYAEIASIVGISTNNTRVKIHRIKEKLAAKFKRHGEFY